MQMCARRRHTDAPYDHTTWLRLNQCPDDKHNILTADTTNETIRERQQKNSATSSLIELESDDQLDQFERRWGLPRRDFEILMGQEAARLQQEPRQEQKASPIPGRGEGSRDKRSPVPEAETLISTDEDAVDQIHIADRRIDLTKIKYISQRTQPVVFNAIHGTDDGTRYLDDVCRQ